MKAVHSLGNSREERKLQHAGWEKQQSMLNAASGTGGSQELIGSELAMTAVPPIEGCQVKGSNTQGTMDTI